MSVINVAQSSDYRNPTFSILSDSTGACNWMAYPLTSITRTGSVATVTFNDHGLTTGDRIYIQGADQAGYNGVKTVTSSTQNTFTYAVDSSTVTPATGTLYGYVEKRCYAQSWFSIASGLAKASWKLIDYRAVPGETVAQIAARVNDSIASGAQYIIIIGGGNDLWTVSKTDTEIQTLFNSLTAIVDTVLLSDRVPILCTCMPDNGIVGATITNRKQIMKFNQLIRDYCFVNPKVILCDFYAQLIDSTNADGYAKTNAMSVDNMHPGAYGAQLMGTALYNALFQRVNIIDYAPMQINDTATRQLSWNPLFNGTGTSSFTSGVTVTNCPDYGVATKIGTGVWTINSATRTTGSDGDAFGKNIVLSTANAGNGDVVQVGQGNFLSQIGSATAVYGTVHLQITGASRLALLKVGLQAKISSLEQWTTCYEIGSGLQTGMNDINLTLRTPKCIIPAGCTELGFYVVAQTGTTGAVTIKMGRNGVWEWT